MCRWSCALSVALVMVMPLQAQEEPSRRDDKLYQALREVLNEGAALYNSGDRNGCHRLYQGTLLILERRFAADAEMHKLIERALASNNRQRATGEQAFALRTAIVEIRNRVGPNPGAMPPMGEDSAASSGGYYDAGGSQAETAAPKAARRNAPRGLPPQQALASLDEEGNIQVQYAAYKPVWTEEKRDIDGRTEVVKKMKWVSETCMMKVEIKQVQVYTAAGRKLDGARLPPLLAKPRTVLTATGELPDPGYLDYYKADTLLLVLPMPQPIAPPAPEPARTPAQ